MEIFDQESSWVDSVEMEISSSASPNVSSISKPQFPVGPFTISICCSDSCFCSWQICIKAIKLNTGTNSFWTWQIPRRIGSACGTRVSGGLRLTLWTERAGMPYPLSPERNVQNLSDCKLPVDMLLVGGSDSLG